MDEGSASLCAGREFSCCDVLETFYDGLRLVERQRQDEVQSFLSRCGRRSESAVEQILELEWTKSWECVLYYFGVIFTK